MPMLRQTVTMKVMEVSRILLLLCLWMQTADSGAAGNTVAGVMGDHLKCYPMERLSFKKQNPSIVREDLCLAAIYRDLGGEPLWVSEDGPGLQAEIILRYLKDSVNEGLNPDAYQVKKMGELWTDSTLESLAQLDTLLTYGVVKYIHDVSYGRLKSYGVTPEFYAEAENRGVDPPAVVERILTTEDLDDFFQSLPPRHRQYRGLKKALSHYRSLKYSGEWPVLAGKKSIRLGDEDERIVEIRKRIAILEDADVDNPENSKDSERGNPAVFDDALLEKVRRFQRLHGLEQDGIIGRKTIRELNRSPDERLAQIRVNMARWRWSDHELGDKYVLVNIANFTLYAYKAGKLAFGMPVIVGTLKHPTPVFSGNIQYLEFNPYWNVPVSIAVNEQLPELRKNPNYLVENNIRLFSSWQRGGVELDSTAVDWSEITFSEMSRFKLRQDPGPGNALGRVKFVFPNRYSIYLHDTPGKRLFSRHRRAFSHGCIRVSEPEMLALFLLDDADGKWDSARVKALIKRGRRRVQRIRPPLPVYITYQTAWVDKEGQVIFNNDFYLRDTTR